MPLEVDVPLVPLGVNDEQRWISHMDSEAICGFIVSCLNFLLGIYFRNFPDPKEVI